MDGLTNLIRREVARCLARYAHPVVGIITSYDPLTHSVKVQYQPEGTLSGWIPLNAAGVGVGFGVFVGPHIGHAVSIGFQEGDREAPFVIGRFATDIETPVSVAEGEIVAKHESGSLLSLLKDGSVHLSGSGTSVSIDNVGNAAVAAVAGKSVQLSANGSTLTIDNSGNITVSGGASGAAGMFADSNNALVSISPSGGVAIVAAAGQTIQLNANGSSLVIGGGGAISITLAAGQGMTVNGGTSGVSIDGAGNCTVNGTSVFLGGSTGLKKVVLDGDTVVAGHVVASSTIVQAK